MLRCAHYQKNPLFELFGFLDAQKNGFGARGRFWDVFDVQKIIDLFTMLTIFYKFALILLISCSYEPSRQYGPSPFKFFLKIEMIVKWVSGKSGFFN